MKNLFTLFLLLAAFTLAAQEADGLPTITTTARATRAWTR
jgi:hypothetical protein